MFNFPSVAAFLTGTANAFNTTLGERGSVIDQRAVGLFVQDQIAVHDRLTLDLGMRYEWHVTPTERDNRFVVFDAARASLVRVGVDVDEIYAQNNLNVEPRAGVAWQVSSDGRTVLRAAYARAVDEPGTTAVRDTAGNPPFGIAADGGRRRFRWSARSTRRGPPGSRRPRSIRDYRNASVQSWNVNRAAATRARHGGRPSAISARTAAICASRATSISRSTAFVRSPRVSALQPHSARRRRSATSRRWRAAAFRTTDGAWVSVTKRLSRGLQFETSYTWSKSLDTNSLNSSGFAVQNSYDIAERVRPVGFRRAAPVRRRARSTICRSPGTSLIARLAGCRGRSGAERQSGEHRHEHRRPQRRAEHRASRSSPDRSASSVRSDQWFDPSVFVAVNRFGDLGRNAVIGPAFYNTDLSVVKNARLGDGRRAAVPRGRVRSASTIPTSARRATSSAARRSARSRGRACRRVKRDRRGRCSSPCHAVVLR